MEVQDINRMLWQSRRGVLELDLILRNYIVTCYAKISDELKLQLESLLEEDDPQMLDWLVYKSPPPPKHSKIVADILASTQD
ncbi:MAG: succinate dehydrogenase assembly factor 2 [Gammaproteobacteria bacterium]|nr:succinate dehydrogenase assembly factor 2 [Gammaproteobacteria bacterium]